MKLQLLVVVAVAILVPNLCESRIINKCDLKAELEAKIKLPKCSDELRQRYLALVVCEVEKRSKLNTAHFELLGQRKTTTTKPATTTTTTTVRRRRRREAGNPEDTEGPEDSAVPKAAPALTPEDEFKCTDIEAMLQKIENEIDEQEENEDENSHVNPNAGEKGNEDENPWSLGYYGIFGLNDGHYCDSGYRWSRNVCQVSCTAFTDEDITDDIRCLVDTNAHWYFLTYASVHCGKLTRSYQDFFKDC